MGSIIMSYQGGMWWGRHLDDWDGFIGVNQVVLEHMSSKNSKSLAITVITRLVARTVYCHSTVVG